MQIMTVKVKDVLDALQQMQKSLECSICLELLKDPHSTKCNHQFCGQCIKQVLEKSGKKSKNKWYCPLCKTPVSKRSLTPNPKLNEIVAAVRSLQGAVQDDTGVSTGAPPSQPSKSCLAGSHLSNAYPSTVQKGTTSGRGKQNGSRKNQFSVFIDNDDNADQGLESLQPQLVTNTNIRSSLQPSTVTQTAKNTKSRKEANKKFTRMTRNSRRLAEKNHTVEEISNKNISDELLHMIDTMSFQPVTNEGPTSPSGDYVLVPNTLESNPDQNSIPSLHSSASTKNASAADKKGLSCKGTCAYEQQERNSCLTTVAEADSSIMASPSAAFCEKKSSVVFENAGSNKDNEEAVSSTKCDFVAQCSVETMQSVSILQSLDCFEDVHGEVCEVSKEGAVHQSEDDTSQRVNCSNLVLNEMYPAANQDKQCDAVLDGVCNESQEKHNHKHQEDTREAVKSDMVDSIDTRGLENQDELCDEVPGGFTDKEAREEDNQQSEHITGQGNGTNEVILIERPKCVLVEDQDEACIKEPDDVCYQSKHGDNHPSTKDISSQGDERNKLIPAESCDSENKKVPFEAHREKLSNSERLPEPADTTEPLGGASSGVRDLPEQSLDFEGLVSLLDDPSLSKPQVPTQEAKSFNENSNLGKPEKERISPRKKGRDEGEAPRNETTDPTNLCDRVKQRQRRRTIQMPFKTSRHSDTPKSFDEWKTRPKKRSADSVIEVKTNERPIPEGRAKKKFKASKSVTPCEVFPVIANKIKEQSQVDSGDSNECQKATMGMTAKGDENVGVDSYSCSSGRTELSNEVIPPSVSSSDTSNSPLINPMIAHSHANQTSRGQQRGDTRGKGDRGSQKEEEDGLGGMGQNCTFMEEDPISMVKGEESYRNEKGRNAEAESLENSFNDKESSTNFTASQTSSASQEPFVCATASQGKTLKYFISKRKEQIRAQLNEDCEGIGSPRKESPPQVCGESHSTGPTLFATCDKSSQSDKNADSESNKETATQVNIEDTSELRNALGSSQDLSPKQKQLTHSPNENTPNTKQKFERKIMEKRPTQAALADAKTAETLSQEGQYSSNTPTQSSLDPQEIYVMTPCLFGNDSWDTPDRRTSQKRVRNQRRHRAGSIAENCEDIPRYSKTTGLVADSKKENITKLNRVVGEADVERMCTLDDSQSRNPESCPFSGENHESCNNREELTSDTNHEGTQSFGTSQSISVLRDLEFPSQEQQEFEDCDDGLVNHSAESSNTEAKRATSSWAEPLPKKPRRELHSSAQEMDASVSSELQRGGIIENTNNSEHTESEVIPPTPPINPVSKKVLGSFSPSPLRESRSKLKSHRNDEAIKPQHERLAVKQKRRSTSLRFSKSQDNKDDGTKTAHSSLGSESNEASVSLLADHSSSPMMENAEDKGFNDVDGAESYTNLLSTCTNKQLVSSQDKNTANVVSETDVTPNKSPNDLTRFSRSCNERKAVGNVQKDLNDRPLSQGSSNSPVWRNESQSEKKSKDFKEDSSPEEGRTNSSPCSPFKQRGDDIGDSFDWSGTRNMKKDHEDFQAGSSCKTLDDGDHKDDNSIDVEDGDRLGALSSVAEAERAHHILVDFRKAKKSKERVDDFFFVDDNDGDCFSVGDEENAFNEDDEERSPCAANDEEDSSGDEDLLKPVFLPKDSESQSDERSCPDDVEDNDEGDMAAFSQELIPAENDDEYEDEVTASCKPLDSTGASSVTFLSETAASTQKMEVLRQDVEAMEKEMEELRAYLAKADENREGTDITNEDHDMDYAEDDQCDEPDIQPSLTPPPPLTPKRIPPMRQLSTPLKDVSRYLDQEGVSSDEGSEHEDAELNDPVDEFELRKGYSGKGDLGVADKSDSRQKSAKKRSLSPRYEDDGLSITAVEHRQEETPSPPRSNRSVEKSQGNDDDKLIILDDRDSLDSRTGSLLLVKRRKVTGDLMPKKSPVVSLLFTKSGKNSEKGSPSPRPVAQSKGSSPLMKNSSSFIYSRKHGPSISPIKVQDRPRPESRDAMSRGRVSRDSMSRKRESREIETSDSVSPGDKSRKGVSRGSVSRSPVTCERLSRGHSSSPDLVLTKVKDVTNAKVANERENRTSPGSGTTRQLSFVATRLNRQQLAEARTLAESYGGKLASEFNSKTSHVIMATDENMQVTRHSYTMKYLLGLALGKWVVSHQWITACKQANTFVAEADYEVKGDSGLGQASIPRKARKARADKEALLFHDFDVLCFGGFGAAVTKEQLSQLLKFCGARVCIDAENLKRTEKGRRKVVTIDKETRDNADKIKAICHQLNTKPVSLEWVTDSIANYKVQDLRDYIVEL